MGKVTTYKGKRIRVLRQVVGGGFKPYKTVLTRAATGKFKVQIQQSGAKANCFRVTVPGTKTCRMTVKNIGCIPLS